MSTLAAPTYLTKTWNRIPLLWGLRFSSCQTWVFQASTFRREGRCESKVGTAQFGLGDAGEMEDPLCPS